MAEGFREFKITDGDLEVDLAIANADIVASPAYDGISQQRIIPHSFDVNTQNINEQLFVDRWNLVYGAVSTNQLSDRVRNLLELLRRAWKYQNESRYITPVYITQKAFCEDNQRYALVYFSPDVDIQSQLFTQSIEVENIIENFGVNIARGIWRSEIPGTTGTIINLTASRGPANPTFVHIANYRDNKDLDTIFRFDSGVGYSANLIATAAHAIFPAAGAAVGDIYYIGDTFPFHNVILNLVTAGSWGSITVVYEYSDGGAGWPAMTLGDDLTLYPDDAPWDQTGQVAINFLGASDWATEVVNGVNNFWIRVRITAIAAWVASPANGTDVVYQQNMPMVEIPATSLLGDTPPMSLIRMRHADGGDENPEMSTTSRIIIGSKSRGLPNFASHINCSASLPGGWGVTFLTDAASVADTFAPGSANCTVTFVDETLVGRVRLTGTNRLNDWVGIYRPFLRCQQTGGNAGEVSVMLRTYLHEIQTYSTKFDTQTVALEGVDNGLEVVDLMPGGVLQIPFTEFENSDVFTGGELYFEIHASRETGTSGDLILYDLILIPVDEWAVELDDPISDSTNGNSALRGLNLLDFDGGVITDRTIKQLISGSSIYPMETWSRRGKRAYLEQEVQTRLYFLMLHYPSGEDWGDPPLIGSLGMHLTYEMYAHMLYYYMRGDE